MFVVNGVPVAIVERKNPKDGAAIERGITQLRRYEKETPELVGAPQLFNVTHLLDYRVWRDLERQPALHGALEAGTRGNLQIRSAGVLRADRLPAHASALDSVLYRDRGRRDPEIGAAPAPAHRDRQGCRALRGRRQKTRSCVAHPMLGQDRHLADRGATNPGGEGALPQRDRDSSSSIASSRKGS